MLNTHYQDIPDFLEGDPIPESMLNTIVPNLREQARKSVLEKAEDGIATAATFGPWMIKHREAVAKPVMEGFIKSTRADPEVGKIAAIGFCSSRLHLNIEKC